jgi:ethanolamine utilization protein EutQ (cupin superfamily)
MSSQSQGSVCAHNNLKMKGGIKMTDRNKIRNDWWKEFVDEPVVDVLSLEEENEAWRAAYAAPKQEQTMDLTIYLDEIESLYGPLTPTWNQTMEEVNEEWRSHFLQSYELKKQAKKAA